MSTSNPLPPTEPPPEATPTSPAPPQFKVAKSKPRPFYQQWDFWAGLLGWYLVNGLVWIYIYWEPNRSTGYGGDYRMMANVIILPVNILVLILAAIFRRRFAGGMLAAVALNFLIAMLIGATMAATCGYPFFAGIRF